MRYKNDKTNHSRFRNLVALCCVVAGTWTTFMVRAFPQDSISIEHISEFEFPSQGFFTPSSFSNQIDNTGREYIYTANKHAGMITFKVDQMINAEPTDTLAVHQFNGLRPTFVVQHGNLLYVALGEFEGLGTQSAGLAIVNIENPEQPAILSQWDSITYNKGCPIVTISDGFAYLGAMEWGVIILDISNSNKIKFKSQLTLDRNYPKEPTPTSEPHARGLALYGDKLLVAHDAGGLRIVDVSDKAQPFEELKYVNDSMFKTTQVAYNKVAVYNDRAYITTDYCGMEVLDLTTLPTIQQGEWHNPFDCMPQSWFGGEGHTNGIKIDETEDLIFMSAGDTEVLVYNVSELAQIHEIGRYQMPDSTVAWSLDVRDDLIVLSCIDNHFFPLQPYYGDFGGIVLLRWKRALVSTKNEKNTATRLVIAPNPTHNQLTVSLNDHRMDINEVSIYNMTGQMVYKKQAHFSNQKDIVDISEFPKGQYIVILNEGEHQLVNCFIKH